MPTVLTVEGHRFFFYSNEGNEPPHIHVEKGDNVAKFWLTPVAYASSAGYTPRELRRVQEIIEANVERMRKAWDEYFSGE